MVGEREGRGQGGRLCEQFGSLRTASPQVLHALELCIFSKTSVATPHSPNLDGTVEFRGSAERPPAGEVRAGSQIFERVPFFQMVGELEQFAHSLQVERDKVREEVCTSIHSLR